MAGTGAKILVGTAGKRRLSPPGRQVPHGATDDPCGCCDCAPCGFCDDLTEATPCRVLLTISGLVLCAGCHIDIGAGQYASWDAGADFDGSYCMTQEPGFPCNWIGSVTGPTLNVYSDSGCTTLIKSISTWGIKVGTAFNSGAGPAFNASIEATDADGTRTVINSPVFATPVDCVTGVSGDPTAGVCDPASTNLASAGGTWTLTPNGC